MANRKLDKKLAKAARAYEKGDRRAGSRLLNEILQADFQHQGAWQLLYQTYGADKSYQEFQHTFAKRYFPEKLDLLDSDAEHLSAPKEKQSFFGRLFSKLRRNNEPAEILEESIKQPEATSKQSADPEQTKSSVKRVSLQPEPKTEEKKTSLSAQTASPTITQQSDQSPLQPPQAISRHTKPRPVAKINASDKIRVLVVDDIELTRENIIRALRFEEKIEVVGYATNGAQAIRMARQYDPDVIVMDVNMPDMDGLTATSHIRRDLPATQVIILTVQDDVDYMRRAMMAGARDFLTKPPMIDELVTAVESAYKFTVEEREKAPPVAVPGNHPSAMSTRRGRIISIYSPRGGSGCSMISANLAASLNKPDSQVVVVDANLQYGDIPVLFNTQSRTSLLDLTSRADELDKQLVEEVLNEHESGVRLLTPPRPEFAEQITDAQFSKVLGFLVRQFQYVIIDTSHRLDNITLAALDISDLIILVTTQDIPSIARTRRFLDLATLMNLDPDRILAVMNLYDASIGIRPDKVGETFKHEISAILPKEIEVAIPSVNRGAPFMLRKDLYSRPLARAMFELINLTEERIAQLEQIEAEAVGV